jgi:hypothetical protein
MSLSLSTFNLEKKDENGNTPFHRAIYSRDWDTINALLNRIVDTDSRHILNIQNNDGDTPLHIAVRRLPLNSLSNKLITFGADTTIENNKGETVEVAKDLHEYFEYVKFDLDLSDLEDDEETKSPITINVVNLPAPVASVPVASLPVASVPVASVPVASAPVASTPIETVQFPQHITVEEPAPALTTEKDVHDSINKSVSLVPDTKEPSTEAVSSFIDKILKKN